MKTYGIEIDEEALEMPKDAYIEVAIARDDGWSGSSEIAHRAEERWDLARAASRVTPAEYRRLKDKAVETLEYGGHSISPEALLKQIAHLKRIGR